jgi:hypothetical protein
MADTKATSGVLAKVGDDEPIFVVRAHDRCAPGTIRDWARRAHALGAPDEKVKSAMECAVDVELWQRDNGCKTPD